MGQMVFDCCCSYFMFVKLRFSSGWQTTALKDCNMPRTWQWDCKVHQHSISDFGQREFIVWFIDFILVTVHWFEFVTFHKFLTGKCSYFNSGLINLSLQASCEIPIAMTTLLLSLLRIAGRRCSGSCSRTGSLLGNRGGIGDSRLVVDNISWVGKKLTDVSKPTCFHSQAAIRQTIIPFPTSSFLAQPMDCPACCRKFWADQQWTAENSCCLSFEDGCTVIICGPQKKNIHWMT